MMCVYMQRFLVSVSVHVACPVLPYGGTGAHSEWPDQLRTAQKPVVYFYETRAFSFRLGPAGAAPAEGSQMAGSTETPSST